jgi:hypothetical protein
MGSKAKKLILWTAILGLGLASASKINNYVEMRDNPGIASEREEVFIPVVNDLLYRSIDPFGYDMDSKLKQFFPNALLGREKNVPQREDAWRLYLGKPQVNNTFSISQYSPENSGEVCYSIDDFFDSYLAIGDPAQQIKAFHERSKLGGNILFGDFGVMGGHQVGISKDEKGSFMFYYDVWDLDVLLERDGGFFGKPFTIYDQLYFDPVTYQPERTIKPVTSLDDLELM